MSKLQVAQTNLLKHLQLPMDGRDGPEKSARLVDCELQHIGNVLPLVGNLEGLSVKPSPPAEFAFHEDIGEKMHLDPDHAVTLALLAAPTLYVARKSGWCITAHLRRRQSAEEIPDRPEDTGVSRRIRTGSPSNRTLVDHHHLVEGLGAENP